MTVTIMICILAAIIGVALTTIGRRKTFVIKFSYSPLDWAEPILMVFVLFSIFFVLEVATVNWFASKCSGMSTTLTLCSKFLDNGLLVPLISLGLSIIFEKMVEGFNLDYLEYYNDKIAKICFSTIVFSWCVVLLAVAWPKMDLMSIEEEIILNRILMWLLTIVGTWFGFGFKCKGRIEKEKKKRNSILKDVDYRKIIGFWLPIVIPLIVCVGILVFVVFFSDQAEKFEKSLFLIALSFTIPGVVMLLLWGRKNNPTKNKVKKTFINYSRNIKRIK